jgi:hypothetical protein
MNSLENEATNCEQALLTLALDITLDPAEEGVLEKHLAECANCRAEAAQYRQLNLQLTNFPLAEPDEAKMQADFQALLESYKREERTTFTFALAEWWQWLNLLLASPLAGRLAFGMAMLLLGWAGGYWLRPKTAGSAQVESPIAQEETQRQDMVLTLIGQSSATDRLRAVSYTDELQQADERVIKALLFTLNHDENVNVRLVTVEALYRFADDPAVREGLVRSIAQQESALVQIALADAMVALHEKRSVAQLRELLHRKGMDASVKEKLESSIRVLL